MPLSPSTLQSQLESLFSAPPASFAECGQAWADAIGAYASGVVPPSATVSTAKTTLAGALTAAFASGAAPPLMETAFLAFGATVGLGMVPLIAVPPAVPVGLVSQFAGPQPNTHAEAATQISNLIHVWMSTGIANTVPPTSPIPWT